MPEPKASSVAGLKTTREELANRKVAIIGGRFGNYFERLRADALAAHDLKDRNAVLEAENGLLREAMPPSHRLRLLADWFDTDDRKKERDPASDEVQRDLRLWAAQIDAALSPSTKGNG